MSPRGSSIDWGSRLMKRRSLVRIPLSPSCVDMSKKKKKNTNQNKKKDKMVMSIREYSMYYYFTRHNFISHQNK